MEIIKDENTNFFYADDIDGLVENFKKSILNNNIRSSIAIQNQDPNDTEVYDKNSSPIPYYSKLYVGDPPTNRFDNRPRDLNRIYFYYLKLVNNKLVNREYIYPSADYETSGHINVKDMKTEIGKFINHAHANELTCDNSEGFDDVKWRGPSYLAFLLDNDDWDFLTANDECDALHFRHEGEFWRNKTFYAAKIREIKIADGSHKKVLVCENYHFKAQNIGLGTERKIGDKADPYKFDLYFKAPLCVGGKTEDVVIIIDPTGTNFGPPKSG